MNKLALEPPEDLKPATREWWCNVVAEHEMGEVEIRLLTLACQSWDRSQEARHILENEGITYLDRFNQPRKRPEVGVEIDNKIAFARLVRELNLTYEEPSSNYMMAHQRADGRR